MSEARGDLRVALVMSKAETSRELAEATLSANDFLVDTAIDSIKSSNGS